MKRMRGDKGTEGGHGKRMREEGKGITTHHVICTFLRCVLLCNVLKNTGLFCRGSCPLPFFCTGDVNVVVQRFIKVPPNVCARVWRGPPFFSFSSLVCLVLLLLHPVLSSVPCCASPVASPERPPRARPFSAPRTSLLSRFSLAQWSPCLCAVERLVNGGRDRLNLCPQLLLDLVQVVTVVVRDQIDRHAEVPETPRPPEKSKLKFSIVSYGVRSQCKR